MKKLEMTWDQFQELRKHCDAINHAHNLEANEGILKNTIVASEWTPTKVEIKLDLAD